MSDLLHINGIRIPVAIGGATLDPKDIGEEHEAEDGTPIVNRRATKQRWSFRTPPQLAQTALATRDLILGRGNVFSFDSSFYSAQGLAPVLIESGFTLVTALAPKFGAGFAASTGGDTGTWNVFTASSPWTVELWLSNDDTGSDWANHYVLRSDGSKWQNGVRNDAASTPFVGVSSGQLRLGTGTSGDYSFDDLVTLPFMVPTDWPSQMYDQGNVAQLPFSPLPYLDASGLMIEQGATVRVIGSAGQLRAFKSGTSDAGKNVQDFSFTLKER